VPPDDEVPPDEDVPPDDEVPPDEDVPPDDEVPPDEELVVSFVAPPEEDDELDAGFFFGVGSVAEVSPFGSMTSVLVDDAQATRAKMAANGSARFTCFMGGVLRGERRRTMPSRTSSRNPLSPRDAPEATVSVSDSERGGPFTKS